MKTEEAEKLDWGKLTNNFSEISIVAFVDLQNNQTDKLAVVEMISDAIRRETPGLLYGEQLLEKMQLIRTLIEQGGYSPYREINRLIEENRIKDVKITDFMSRLESAKRDGDEQKEEELITDIIGQTLRLGADVARNVELILGRIYRGQEKFPQHFDLLEKYIARPEVFEFHFKENVGILAPGATIDIKDALRLYE